MRINPPADTACELRAPVAVSEDSLRQQLADERFARLRKKSIERSIKVLDKRFPNKKKRFAIFRSGER